MTFLKLFCLGKSGKYYIKYYIKFSVQLDEILLIQMLTGS